MDMDRCLTKPNIHNDDNKLNYMHNKSIFCYKATFSCLFTRALYCHIKTTLIDEPF